MTRYQEVKSSCITEMLENVIGYDISLRSREKFCDIGCVDDDMSKVLLQWYILNIKLFFSISEATQKLFSCMGTLPVLEITFHTP